MTTRYNWNDDDRKNDYISYYHRKDEEYVPVYKILKEMYDEDKANLYIYDTEEEYQYKYGQYYFNRYCDYYDECYSPSNLDDINTDDTNTYDNDGEDISDHVVETDDIVEENRNDVEKVEQVEHDDSVEAQQVECIDETKSKFIYT
jgi:hypothetical protein